MNRVLLYIGKGNERYCYAVINSKQYPRGGAGEREIMIGVSKLILRFIEG